MMIIVGWIKSRSAWWSICPCKNWLEKFADQFFVLWGRLEPVKLPLVNPLPGHSDANLCGCRLEVCATKPRFADLGVLMWALCQVGSFKAFPLPVRAIRYLCWMRWIKWGLTRFAGILRPRSLRRLIRSRITLFPII